MVFHESRGEAERERDGSTATFTPDVDLPEALRAPAMGLHRLQCGEAWRVRGSGERKEWATGEASREGLGLYIGSLAQGARCTLRMELDGEGGVPGRRCEPSPGIWVAVSVA
jgi:hypothetical protein